MQFELFVAARYLRAKRRQAVIGVITIISIIGVAAGVASLIIALAINNGFRQDLQERLLGSTSHINLLRVESDGIRNWQDLLARLQKQPHVLAGAPAIYEQVLISRGARAQGAILKGIIPQDERKVSDILDTIKSGSADSLDAAKKIRARPRLLTPTNPIRSRRALPLPCRRSFWAKTWPTNWALLSGRWSPSPARRESSRRLVLSPSTSASK